MTNGVRGCSRTCLPANDNARPLDLMRLARDFAGLAAVYGQGGFDRFAYAAALQAQRLRRRAAALAGAGA